jgi:opacity protein-like surface antigen
MRYLVHFILFGLMAGGPASAWAQRVPTTDSAAVGGDIGLFLPRDDTLSGGPTLEGFYEYYFEPRTSVRLGMGWANPKFDRDDEDSMRYVRVAADLVYNWEGGAVHPFGGAGLGAYFLQEKDNGRNIGDSETKFGGTLFGGVEFFSSRTFAVKAEAKYHVISNAGGFNPDGLSLTIGAKKYF